MAHKTKEQRRVYAQQYRARHRKRTNTDACRSYYKRRIVVLRKLTEVYRAEREWLNALKATPCVDCGISYPPCVMEFDHIRGVKKYTIGRMLGSQHRRATN